MASSQWHRQRRWLPQLRGAPRRRRSRRRRRQRPSRAALRRGPRGWAGRLAFGRPQRQGLDGGHPARWRGGGVCACYAGRRHQVKWRGLGGGAGEGGPSVAPGQRRAPKRRVVGGGESSDAIAATLPPVQVNGGVGVGLSRVERGDVIGRRGRGRAPYGCGARAAAAQPAENYPGGGSGGRGGAGRWGG